MPDTITVSKEVFKNTLRDCIDDLTELFVEVATEYFFGEDSVDEPEDE